MRTHDSRFLWYNLNGQHLALYPEDAKLLPRTDAECVPLARSPYIAEQLDVIGEEALRKALETTGLFTTGELDNAQRNRLRFVWLACWDVVAECVT